MSARQAAQSWSGRTADGPLQTSRCVRSIPVFDSWKGFAFPHLVGPSLEGISRRFQQPNGQYSAMAVILGVSPKVRQLVRRPGEQLWKIAQGEREPKTKNPVPDTPSPEPHHFLKWTFLCWSRHEKTRTEWSLKGAVNVAFYVSSMEALAVAAALSIRARKPRNRT